MRRHAPRLAHLWQDFLAIKAEEAFLVRTNLMHVDVIVSGFRKLLDLLNVPGRIGSTHDPLGDVICAYKLRRLGKMCWRRQLLGQFAFEAGVGPVLMSCTLGTGLVSGPADGELPVARFASPASGLETLWEALLGCRAD